MSWARRGRWLFSVRWDPARLSHGYVFSGPAGTGKKTFARRLAQSLLCERPKAGLLGYCNGCRACTLMQAGTHPDFVESVGEMKIGESGDSSGGELTARELVRSFSLHGYLSAHRILLLGDLKFSTHAAPNALLKFFEEPPPGFLAIVTTDAPGSLLATIRSRLIDVPFGLLSEAQIATILQRRGIDPAEAARVAPAALGSVERAFDILGRGNLDVRSAALAWFGAALAGEAFDLQLDERGDTAAERREALTGIIEHVRIIARDWAAGCIAGAEAPMLAADLRAGIASLPQRSPGGAVTVLEAIGDGLRMSRTNVSASQVAEYMRVALAP